MLIFFIFRSSQDMDFKKKKNFIMITSFTALTNSFLAQNKERINGPPRQPGELLHKRVSLDVSIKNNKQHVAEK